MKKLLATLLAAILLLACIPALADAPAPKTHFAELGLDLDITAITDKCVYTASIETEGILDFDPYVAMADVYYCALPRQQLLELNKKLLAGTDEEQDAIYNYLAPLRFDIGHILVTNATDMDIAELMAYNDVDPADEKSVMVFNTEVLFGMMDNLFDGVDLLIWLVGIGTLLAGAIGVSNIMMVTVKERTTEIGIRRAIGATPRVILTQIISESILLTAVAGMTGILFAVMILQMMELGFTEDGIVQSHFQVTFWVAVGAAALLAALGVLAGLAPAARAMAIKPVDAMREE